MTLIRQAVVEDSGIIRKIAHQTWPHTFKDILSVEQISFMLEMMYSEASLKEQFEVKGHHFLLAFEKEWYLGFAAYEHNHRGSSTTKIHKIYVLPQAQGKGVGKLLIDTICEYARDRKNLTLSLNVNKNNPAIGFYKKNGFEKTGEECLPIGNGFVMDDIIMEKKI